MNLFVKNDNFENRNLAPTLIAALLGICAITLVYYPGLMSADSINQLIIARNASYGEWHPAIMSYVWRQFDRVLPGPLPMLIFHNLMFWGGLAVLCQTLFRSTWAKVFAVLAFGFYPPYLALLGTVWKDVGMGASYVLFVGLTLRGREKGNVLCFIGALLCLFYGTGVRHNALTAFPPLLFWWAWCLPKRINRFASPKQYSAVKRVGVALTMTVILGSGLWLGNRVIQKNLELKENTYYVNPNLQAVLLFDLSAISIKTGELLLPQFELRSRPHFTLKEIKDLYYPANCNPLLSLGFTPDDKPHFHFTNDGVESAELKALWLQAVINHPGDYIEHRFLVFKSLIGLNSGPVCYPRHDGIDPNNLGVTFKSSRINRLVNKVLKRLDNSILFRGWLYLALIPFFILLVVGLGRSEKVAITCLGLSGVLYLAPYFFIAGSCDFRYYWWTVLAVGLMALFFFSSKPLPSRR